MPSLYQEKFKDPRWQKLRLRILERDGWKCLACHGTADTLHIHHSYYIAGRDPWNYPDGTMVTLCDDCHALEQDMAAKGGNGPFGFGNWELEAAESVLAGYQRKICS